MKMKLLLTRQELLKVLGEYLKADIIDVEIVENMSAMLVSEIQTLKFQTTEKIAAIKKLREIALRDCRCEMGLAEAKYAIENWDRFIQYVRIHNTIPVDTNY